MSKRNKTRNDTSNYDLNPGNLKATYLCIYFNAEKKIDTKHVQIERNEYC